jgi:hypothetical protein
MEKTYPRLIQHGDGTAGMRDEPREKRSAAARRIGVALSFIDDVQMISPFMCGTMPAQGRNVRP